MLLGKLPVPGHFTNLIIVGQGPIALVIGAGGSCSDIFSFRYHFYLLFPSPWEMARYRLEYCLKGLLNLKQPTNLPVVRSKTQCYKLRVYTDTKGQGSYASKS